MHLTNDVKHEKRVSGWLAMCVPVDFALQGQQHRQERGSVHSLSELMKQPEKQIQPQPRDRRHRGRGKARFGGGRMQGALTVALRFSGLGCVDEIQQEQSQGLGDKNRFQFREHEVQGVGVSGK